MTITSPPPFEIQLISHRDYLLRFARLQLRNDAWAEDAVSETVLAALAKPQAFENRSEASKAESQIKKLPKNLKPGFFA